MWLLTYQLAVYLFLYSLKNFSLSQPWRAHQTPLRLLFLLPLRLWENFSLWQNPYA